MGVNRSISALKPILAERLKAFLAYCDKVKFPVVVVETDRLQIVQDAYYAQGRANIEKVNWLRNIAGLYLIKERENKIITNALVSNHTGGGAVDMCPEIPGKPCHPWWNASDEIWRQMGGMAETFGLDWCAGGYGQTWGKGWDNPHFELLEDWKEAA